MGVRLYFDLETYRPRNEDAFINERIIAIGVIEDRSRYAFWGSQNRGSAEVRIFSEWELGSEKEAASSFCNYVRELAKEYGFKRFELVGFNILRFDVPLIICKAARYDIMPIDIASRLFHNVMVRDLFQQLLLANENRYKGCKLDRLYELLNELGYKGILKPYGNNKDVAK